MTIRSDRPVGPDGWMTNTARMDMRSVGARHAGPPHRVRGPEGAKPQGEADRRRWWGGGCRGDACVALWASAGWL